MKDFSISMQLMRICGAFVAFLLATGVVRADGTVSPANLTLVGVAQADGVTYASVVDAQTGEHFLPSTRAADGGVELLEVTAEQDAVIRQNGQSYVLKLGWPQGTGTAGNVPPPVPVAQAISRDPTAPPPPPPGAKLPLVFQSGDLKRFHLTDAQKAAILQLRQQFLAAIAGDPAPGATTSPSAVTAHSSTTAATATDSGDASSTSATPWFQDWPSAQEESDARFKMLFGYEAFNQYEMELQSTSAP